MQFSSVEWQRFFGGFETYRNGTAAPDDRIIANKSQRGSLESRCILRKTIMFRLGQLSARWALWTGPHRSMFPVHYTISSAMSSTTRDGPKWSSDPKLRLKPHHQVDGNREEWAGCLDTEGWNNRDARFKIKQCCHLDGFSSRRKKLSA